MRRWRASVRRASWTTTPTLGGIQARRCIWRSNTSTAWTYRRLFNVTHRDIKPANVALRNDDITKPVLVDFGLSFNDSDADDLTRVGEEVGNRFLRLPEHAFGERGAASDVAIVIASVRA
jgi:serine/threonine protein kinase